ncbi:hypothetical protein N7466_009991 [Penicillium verhagenii]|uniref:uncharacterized protein n=1 Tax=Penicillium verhagenii TaxID=1562060 RepID=UPI002545673F|nr:uncharacterized protein N7466_009991 [Penicillium verhagenii]KAJ5919048.1 hypothetical protein N7466_009991 [Penicillium verhagenii]
MAKYAPTLPFRSGITLLASVLLLIPIYVIGLIIYNVYFHPLAKYPGPKSMAATRIPNMRMVAAGEAHRLIPQLHEKYGPVVRVAPNELSFTTSGEAWKPIYGTRPGHSQKPKNYLFYQEPIGNVPNIINSNDADHTRFRRSLSHAFSDSSLRGQEPIIKGYVNLFIQRLHEITKGGSTPVDIVSWYNFTTFDVIGDLAFGEPFNCLENSDYHPWVSMIFAGVKAGALIGLIRRVPYLEHLKKYLAPRKLLAAKMDHEKLTMEKVQVRMGKSNERPDFFANILTQKDPAKAFSEGELYSNASLLIIAGSETTATLLAGVTYLLLRSPHALTKLNEEVRGAFKSDEDATLEACNQLSYLQACLTEALRMYPPVPVGLPRVIDSQGDMIDGNWVPGGITVSVSHIATYNSEGNFKDAKQFMPERHLDDPRFASDNKDSMQPFSFGPRNCIGRNLAYVEMRMILARMIINFDMELAEPHLDWMDQKTYNLWEKPPLMLNLIPRDLAISEKA